MTESTLDEPLLIHPSKDKGIPAFLILHVADRPDARLQARAFAKALAGAGVSVKRVPSEGKTHANINRDLGLPEDKPPQAIFEFLDLF